MKFSVIIPNHNYAHYLQECVDSVLSQTLAPHEIIVVDDGSSDDSLEVLRRLYADHPLVKIISQPNDGQMMAVAQGIEQATGDIICLLDSDDRYKAAYLQELDNHYVKNPHVDLTFCRFESFGVEPFQKSDDFVWPCPPSDYDCGCSALLTYFGKVMWIGNSTSTLSLRRRMARRLKLREVALMSYTQGTVDFAVLLGASLLGGVKYYLYKTLVDYRQHSSSVSRKRKASEPAIYQRQFFHQTIYNFYRERSGLTEDMRNLMPAEASTIPNPTPAHRQLYTQPKPPTMVSRGARYLARRLNARFNAPPK